MGQKILVKLRDHCDKCRIKALKIAATVPGVTKLSIQGGDLERDHLVVIGDGVDPVCLTKAIRKKLGSAVLVSVEQIMG